MAYSYPHRDPDVVVPFEELTDAEALHKFAVSLSDALSGHVESTWKEPWYSPDMRRNPLFEYVEKRRQKLRPMITRAILLGLKCGQDVRPLRWFEKYIHGDAPLTEEAGLQTMDTVRNIMLLVSGEDFDYYRMRMPERAPVDLVALDDFDAIAQIAKQTLANLRHKHKDASDNCKPPEPVQESSGRVQALYSYAAMRDWLIAIDSKYTSKLPESFEEARQLAISARGGMSDRKS